MDTQSILLNNMKYLMDMHGIDLATELARRANLNQPTVHRILSGEVRDPRISRLQAIGEAQGIPYWALTELDCEASGISQLDSAKWMSEKLAQLASVSLGTDVLRLRAAIELAITSIQGYKGGALPTPDEMRVLLPPSTPQL